MPDRVTRTHIAKTLVEKSYVSRAQQAFDKYIKEGKEAYVKFDGLGLKKLLSDSCQWWFCRIGASDTDMTYLRPTFVI